MSCFGTFFDRGQFCWVNYDQKEDLPKFTLIFGRNVFLDL